MNYGDESVQLVEVDQPFCSRTYGSAPCTAQLGVTGEHKCHNTRATCQDPANYDGSEVVTLRFVRKQTGVDQYANTIPVLREVSTTPTKLNLGGMRTSNALGQREVVNVRLEDVPHDDQLVDKYRLERSTGAAQADGVGYEPYEHGTLIGKWLARNPFHPNYALRVREGTMGQALEDMRVRHYLVDRVEGPTDGQVTIVAKDLFSKIEAKKAVAPRASRGELAAAIAAGAGSATLSPAGIGDLEYPASGHVCIGSECIAFTRVGDVLTFTQRGALNTVAAAHDEEDLVQLVLSYTAQRAHDIVYDLLVNYSEIPAAIDKAQWDINASDLDELYTARIVTPEPIMDLIGELARQAGFTVWPNVVTGMVEFAALRAGVPLATVDDDNWIVDGSLSKKRLDETRISQVHFYYAQIDPTESVEDRQNYRSRRIIVDLPAESPEQYGAPVIRNEFSRWIPQFGGEVAAAAGERILAMFRDPPLEVAFTLHASKAGALQLGRYFNLVTAEVQNPVGLPDTVIMAAVQVEHGEHQIRCLGQQVTFAPQDADAERAVPIENDVFDINLRDIHDTLFAAPTVDTVVRFTVFNGITVGSNDVESWSILTGIWP